jgi:sterol desaturase/sphingolipid hydroxylase (fatty acid hydroxylase superfamily)
VFSPELDAFQGPAVPLSNVVSIAFGVALVVLGAVFLRRHRRTWNARKANPALPAEERSYFARQHRRRMLTSSLIVMLGVLIPIGDLLFERKPAPPVVPLTLFWIGVLLVVLWVLLLGVLDLFATGLHAKDAMSRVDAEKAALEHQLEEIRRAMRENGEPGRGL